MGKRPLASGAQTTLQGRQPLEEVQVGHRAHRALSGVVGQALEEHVVIRRICAELLGRIEPERPATLRLSDDRSLDNVEPAVLAQDPLVTDHGCEVGIGQQKSANSLRCGRQFQRRSDDHRDLSETANEWHRRRRSAGPVNS